MKKIILFLCLIFLVSFVSALERCTYTSIYMEEINGVFVGGGGASLVDVTEGVPFNVKFKFYGYYDDGTGTTDNCWTDINMMYKKNDVFPVLAQFIQIPDTTFVPPAPSPATYELDSLDDTYCDCIATGCHGVNLAYVDIDVVCNMPRPAEVADYRFGAKSSDCPSCPNNPTASPKWINCIAAAGPVNTPPSGSFTKPAGDSAVYGGNYVVEWDAFDAEGDPLTYTFYWENESLSDVGSNTTGNGGTDQFYTMTNMVIGEDYAFSVVIDDGTDTTEFFSDTLSVMPPLDYLSISALTVTPDVINGDGKINVYLEVRNESDRLVDINVWFYNNNFDDGPIAGEHFRREVNVPANSKQSFSMDEDFVDLSVPLTAGEYPIEVVVQGFFSGTRESTNSKDISVFAYFTVLAQQKSLSLPETGILAVLLILVAVALILRKKKK